MIGPSVDIWSASRWWVNSLPLVGAWLRSDMGITLNGSDVSGWADQSGAGSDFAQATASQQMAYSASGGVNGFPKLTSVSANSQYLAGPATNSLIASSPFSLIVVCTSAAAGGSGIAGNDSGVPRFRLGRTDASYNDLNNLSYAADNTLAVRHWLHDGTNFKYRHNGVEKDTVAVALSALTVGALTIGRTLTTYSDADFYEYILAASALTGGGINDVEGYLLRRYGITP